MANICGGKEHASMGERTSKRSSKKASKQAKERARENDSKSCMNESTLNVLKDNESWSFAHLAHFAKDLFYEFNSCMIKGQIDQWTNGPMDRQTKLLEKMQDARIWYLTSHHI